MMADEPLMNTSPAEEEARSRTRNVALVSAAIVVALLVVAGVAVGIFFILESDSNSNNNDDNDATKPLFSFDDIFNPDFVPTRFSCLWIEDGRCVTELYDAGQTMLLAYEPQAGTAEQGPTFQQQPFLAADQFPQDAEVWIVSPNAQYVLFGFNVQNVRISSSSCCARSYPCDDSKSQWVVGSIDWTHSHAHGATTTTTVPRSTAVSTLVLCAVLGLRLEHQRLVPCDAHQRHSHDPVVA